MDVRYHRLPASYLGELASGGGSPAAIELLRQSQYSKHVLLLQAIASASPAAGAAWDLLTRAQRADAAATAAVLRYPAVGAWAYRTVLAVRGGGPPFPGATPDGLREVAAAAAIRAGLTAEVEVSARDGVVMLPSLGAVHVPAGPAATVRVAPGGTQVRAAGKCVTIPPDGRAVPGWRPLRSVLAGMVVDDIDPFRMPAAPHVAPAPGLGPWRSAFAEARGLLERHHPATAAEVAALVSVVVPLAKPPQGQVSSSSPEAFGAIAMSEPPGPVDLAATLAHETQHMKLSAVLYLVQLTHPDDGSRYYAPWREDPRPVGGLLQGAYAFLGVTAFWRRQRNVTAASGTPAEAEFARWRNATALVCQTLLGSGRLTRDGETFVTTMAETLRPWERELVSEDAQRRADEEARRHAARWEAQHG